jgi:hypothetical protein
MLSALQGIQHTLHILGLDIVRFEWKVDRDIIYLDGGWVRAHLYGSGAAGVAGCSGKDCFGCAAAGVGGFRGGRGLAFVVGGQHGALQTKIEILGWRVLEHIPATSIHHRQQNIITSHLTHPHITHR